MWNIHVVFNKYRSVNILCPWIFFSLMGELFVGWIFFLFLIRKKKCLSMLSITEDSRYWLDGLFVY